MPQAAAQATPAASQAVQSAAPAPARSAAKPSTPAVRPVAIQQQPAASQKPAQPYDMPWDPVPASSGQRQATPHGAAAPSASQMSSQGASEDVPPYEEVPYDDADAMNYGDDAQMYGDIPAPAAQPAAGGAPFSTGASAQRTFGQPATAATGSNGTASNGAGSNGAGASANGGASASGAAAGSAPVPPKATFDASTVPDDIPDDLRAIIEDAFEVFGDGVKVSSVEPAPTDEELSEELDASEMDDEDDSGDAADDSSDGFVDDAEADDDEEADG